MEQDDVRVFEAADGDGNVRRYPESDFDETVTTGDEPEMRRLVKLGWILLDEHVERRDGATGAWADTACRRAAGRVLPAPDDPSFKAAGSAPVYVLGHLRRTPSSP